MLLQIQNSIKAIKMCPQLSMKKMKSKLIEIFADGLVIIKQSCVLKCVYTFNLIRQNVTLIITKKSRLRETKR